MNKNYDAYKSIGEVAEILNLKNKSNGKLFTHTIRYWEKEFKQLRPKIFTGNRRYYDLKTIILLKEIKFLLKDKGMTIKGVKRYLKNKSKLDETINISISNSENIKSRISKISNLIKNLKK